MKYTKFISLILVVAMLMLSGVSVYAAPSVTAVHDVSGTTINISGKTEDINEAGVTLVLLAPNLTDVVDNPETTDVNEREVAIKAAVDAMVLSGAWDEEVVASVEQVFAAADGTYTASFTLPATAGSGDYIVYATSNDVASYELYFSTPANKKGALAEILVAINAIYADEAAKEAGIALVKAKIEEHARELALDLTLVKNEDGSYIAEKDAVLLAAAEALFTNDDLLALPQTAGELQDADLLTAREEIEVEIVNALFNAEIPSDITAYAGKFLETTTPAALTAYGELTAEAKAYARDLVFGEGFANASDMEEMLYDAVKIALIVIDGAKDFVKTKDTATELGLAKAAAFGALTDTQKVNALRNVKISAPKTVSDLDTYFTNAVNSYSGGNPPPDEETVVSPGMNITTGGGNGGDDKPATVVYTDIGNYSWAKDAIYSLTEQGILSGYGAGQFGPSNEIKREEFAKVVVAAMFGAEAADNEPAGSFADANSGWYAPFVGYAERAGIIKGVSATEFGVGRCITRQDIMVMLYRAMMLKGYVANTNSAYIADADEIADYAIEAVNALKNAGIVSGYEDGSIKPTNNATRAEVSVMVDKFLKLFN